MGRVVNAMQNHENKLINANDDASSDYQHVEPSTLSEAPIYETTSRAYQLNDKIEHDDHTHGMVKNK